MALERGTPPSGRLPALRVSAVVKRNYKDQILESLKTAILSSQFEPDRIYSTTDLVEAFGASRTPVREALLSLEQAGLITVQRGIGFQITSPSVEERREALEARKLLEIPIMARLAGDLTDDQLATVDTLLARVGAAGEQNDVAEFLVRDYDFHMFFFTTYGNRHLCSIIENLRNVQRVPVLSTGVTEGGLAERQRHHVEIVNALKNADADAVRHWVQVHLEYSERLWNEIL